MTNDEWASAPFPAYTEAQEAEITRRSPVADVIGEHTSIRRISDGTYRGACPFCNRPDTLEVVPETGRWNCFNCLETGDVMIFINKFLGLWRADAYKFLADRAGLTFGASA
ncbi:CHC2 zinc finger domain-containing protein [Nonomuraea wenchangensis]